jgi:hypothetical protein
MKQHKTQAALAALEPGQIWQMHDSNLHIGVVGKRLVHYKLLKGQAKRSPIFLSGKDVVQNYLRKTKAVLVQPQA